MKGFPTVYTGRETPREDVHADTVRTRQQRAGRAAAGAEENRRGL